MQQKPSEEDLQEPTEEKDYTYYENNKVLHQMLQRLLKREQKIRELRNVRKRGSQ